MANCGRSSTQIEQLGTVSKSFVMDNYSTHKTQSAEELLNASKVQITNTSPFSCKLNPIEFVFCDMHQTITQQEVASSISCAEEIIFPHVSNKRDLSKKLAINYVKRLI
ncbi:MAG: hypothetical protein EZS28_025217 [Streblomastix strix]|uniref:Uncharacterized protein n=1 Tax=Streblomastix strix TaxID=222440 RepID=A0A5J4V9Q6_9EUKA|nr:MAG: hypothetical protein EZS28_025217 [Streblomastix strix]